MDLGVGAPCVFQRVFFPADAKYIQVSGHCLDNKGALMPLGMPELPLLIFGILD